MSKSINQVFLVGNIGKIDTRYIENGSAITNVSLATSSRVKKKHSDEYEDVTEWHNITVFGHDAKYLGDYAAKGAKLTVRGRLKTEKYEKNGEDRYATKVIAEDIVLWSEKDSTKANAATASQYAAARDGSYQKPAQADEFDDDIPF